MAIIGSLPVTLTNGTTADATQVMTDLNWLVSQTNTNAAPNGGVSGNAAIVSAINSFTQVQNGIAGTSTINFPIIDQIQKQSTIWAGTASGATTIALTISPAPGTLTAGHRFAFIAAGNNTGAVTVNVNGTGAVAVVKPGASGAVALVANDIVAGQVVAVTYDGTQYWLSTKTAYAHGADIASASTLNLNTATGDFVHVTGTTTVTAITLNEGVQVAVYFNSALTLTNGASLVLPGGANILTATGDIAIFRGDSSSVVRCVSYTRATGVPVVATPLRNFIDGFVLSNDGTTPATVIDVAAGQCTDSTNAYVLTGTALTKNQNSWVAGTASGGKLNAAAVANNTWYYWYVIYNPSTGSVDYGFDPNSTPTLPTGYTIWRRIGMVKTQAASTNWSLFQQDGDNFYWSSPQTEATNVAKSATASTVTLAYVPPVTVRWYGNVIFTVTSSNGYFLLTPTDATDVAPAVNATMTYTRSPGTAGWFQGYVKAISQQMRIRFDESSSNYWLTTFGWVDQRGKNS